MKKTIFTTATVFVASLLLAGLAMGSGTDAKASGTTAVEGHMGDATMAASHQQVAAHPLSVTQIRELQKLLNDQGYNAGVSDGIIGPNTTAAIRQFQLDSKLTSSGIPDSEMLRLLSPDAKKQEFFGLAPEFGEQRDMMTPESDKMMNKDMMEKTHKKADY